ncbi:MotA/TolQ/ExbB proton channel family protein [Microbulbifer aggregans]|uniref:MotA/TolQ/ExbB proton channel family protein n=1 Tax=Microbulbifer aggregans TaxID=1769779 RepID=UPI001CFE08E2|nr:MotA/TolQ/ExbB proton channel family protein [Microbulbifer aggregans]
MLASVIESALQQLPAATITNVFIITLLGIFFAAIFLKVKDKQAGFTNYVPTLLTSIGILGTFTGIVSGLLNFDHENIQASITLLLGGLKTAFITSILGVFLSLLFKSLVAFGVFSKRQLVAGKEEVDSKDMYAALMAQVDAINKLNGAISDSDESSLMGQLRLMRSESSDRAKLLQSSQDKSSEALVAIKESVDAQRVNFDHFGNTLWIKLQEFADMMSKSATEQVINALKEVISDFNNNLTEQFGENFKQLNASVEKLVVWQQQYQVQLEQMIAQYEQGVTAITQTEVSVASISAESQVIPKVMGELHSVMEVNQHQISELDRHLEAFKDIRDRAVESVPEIRKQIDETIEGAKAINERLASGMQEGVDKVKNVIVSSAEEFDNRVSQTNAALTESSQAVSNSTEQIKVQFQDAISDINNEMRNMVQEVGEKSKSATGEIENLGKELVAQLTDVRRNFVSGLESMQGDLAKSLEDLANEQTRHTQSTMNGLRTTAEDALSQTGESVQKQIKLLDDAMSQELQRVMQHMGQSLTTISGKFTDDYQRLVIAMNDVVKRGQGVA